MGERGGAEISTSPWRITPSKQWFSEHQSSIRKKNMVAIRDVASKADIGQECIARLLERIQQPEKPPMHITLPVELIERSSCRRLSG